MIEVQGSLAVPAHPPIQAGQCLRPVKKGPHWVRCLMRTNGIRNGWEEEAGRTTSYAHVPVEYVCLPNFLMNRFVCICVPKYLCPSSPSYTFTLLQNYGFYNTDTYIVNFAP